MRSFTDHRLSILPILFIEFVCCRRDYAENSYRFIIAHDILRVTIIFLSSKIGRNQFHVFLGNQFAVSTQKQRQGLARHLLAETLLTILVSRGGKVGRKFIYRLEFGNTGWPNSANSSLKSVQSIQPYQVRGYEVSRGNRFSRGSRFFDAERLIRVTRVELRVFESAVLPRVV